MQCLSIRLKMVTFMHMNKCSLRSLQFFVLLCAVSAPIASWSARPLNTDDANIVDPKSCQVETWFKKNHDSTEYWAVPGCNFGYDIEWSVGGQKQWNQSDPNGQVGLIQAKKRWKPLEPGSWGASTTVGLLRSRWGDGTSDQHLDRYLNVPISHAFENGSVVHLNLGLVNHTDLGTLRRTHGLGAEQPVSSSSYLIAETFGEKEQPSRYQVGFRVWLIPQRVQLDTTYGNNVYRTDSQTRWFSIGLRLLSPAFLP